MSLRLRNFKVYSCVSAAHVAFTEHKVSGKGVGVIDHYIRKRNAEHTSVHALCFYLSAIMFLLSMTFAVKCILVWLSGLRNSFRDSDADFFVHILPAQKQIRDEAFESSTMFNVASPVGLFKCSAISSD